MTTHAPHQTYTRDNPVRPPAPIRGNGDSSSSNSNSNSNSGGISSGSNRGPQNSAGSMSLLQQQMVNNAIIPSNNDDKDTGGGFEVSHITSDA